MKFEIRHVKNGLVLEVSASPEETGEKEEIVFQEKYDEGDEIECFADFLFYIHENYAPSTSRYSPKRIYISVAPGDKYEDIQRESQEAPD